MLKAKGKRSMCKLDLKEAEILPFIRWYLFRKNVLSLSFCCAVVAMILLDSKTIRVLTSMISAIGPSCHTFISSRGRC